MTSTRKKLPKREGFVQFMESEFILEQLGPTCLRRTLWRWMDDMWPWSLYFTVDRMQGDTPEESRDATPPRWRNWSNEVCVAHLDYTTLSAEHGFRRQLPVVGPLALWQPCTLCSSAVPPNGLGLSSHLALSTVSRRECVLKCFVKWTVDSGLKFWPHSFLLFDPSCHPETWLSSPYNGEANVCSQ